MAFAMQRSGVRPSSTPPFVFKHLRAYVLFHFRLLARFRFSSDLTALRLAFEEWGVAQNHPQIRVTQNRRNRDMIGSRFQQTAGCRSA